MIDVTMVKTVTVTKIGSFLLGFTIFSKCL